MHRNWPESIQKYRLNNAVSHEEMSESQRLNLRCRNGNSFVKVSDGTLYGPIGGGVVSTGQNVRAVMDSDYMRKALNGLELQLQSQLITLKDEFF